jgi:hypothetical protein
MGSSLASEKTIGEERRLYEWTNLADIVPAIKAGSINHR